MKSRWPIVATAVALVFVPVAAIAQANAAPPLSAASAAPAPKPGPRLLTPAEAGDSASPPGDLRPERPVAPQLTIPFGKKPPVPSRVARPGNAASSGSIDDAAARCEAEPDAQLRSTCRAGLARETGSR